MDNKVKIPCGGFYLGDGLTVDPITRTVSAGGGDGGASSADVFIIHATPDETYTNAQLDKTPEQICEAYQSGKYCLVRLDGAFVPVVSASTVDAETKVSISGLTVSISGQGHILNGLFVTNDGVTWSIEKAEQITLYNVCFNGLQIYGSGGRIYTISVDADGNLTANPI